jgi:hypothetical protein
VRRLTHGICNKGNKVVVSRGTGYPYYRSEKGNGKACSAHLKSSARTNRKRAPRCARWRWLLVRYQGPPTPGWAKVCNFQLLGKKEEERLVAAMVLVAPLHS